MAVTVGMISLGCTKNRVDTEQALGLMRSKGFEIVAQPEKAEVLLVNTCGFIESAKEESIDTILEMAEYKEKGMCRLLVVTGCLAQRYHDVLAEQMPEIDILMGVGQYDKLADTILEALEKKGSTLCLCNEREGFWEQERMLTTPSYLAYTKIGDGCNNCCTYCAIPLIRGHYRSRPMDDILSEIEALAKKGVREHVLVAQDTTRYGTDWQAHTMLPELMERAANIAGVDWLRVLYCYPDETDTHLLDAMAKHHNICKYLDLPIQHINDDILKRMNRRGTSEDIKAALQGARARGFALRTSIIVGFPGETEGQFQELLDFIRVQQFDRLGAFTFSPEDDTLAATMPNQIPEEIKQDRLDRLMKAQAEVSYARNLIRVGTTAQVLITGILGKNRYKGRSQWEAPETDGEILFTSTQKLNIGQFVHVEITNAQTYDLTGVEVNISSLVAERTGK